MAKKIIVHTCRECPNKRYNDFLGGCYCIHLSGTLEEAELKNYPNIPDECPLEDWEELQNDKMD